MLSLPVLGTRVFGFSTAAHRVLIRSRRCRSLGRRRRARRCTSGFGSTRAARSPRRGGSRRSPPASPFPSRVLFGTLRRRLPTRRHSRGRRRRTSARADALSARRSTRRPSAGSPPRRRRTGRTPPRARRLKAGRTTPFRGAKKMRRPLGLRRLLLRVLLGAPPTARRSIASARRVRPRGRSKRKEAPFRGPAPSGSPT